MGSVFHAKEEKLVVACRHQISVNTKDICSVLDHPDIVLTAGSRFLYQFNKI